MFRPLMTLVAALGMVASSSSSSFVADAPAPNVLTLRPMRRRYLSGSGPCRESRTHGYIPHPAAFSRRRRRAPYKGNLGPRH
jgi:hypothetical protein